MLLSHRLRAQKIKDEVQDQVPSYRAVRKGYPPILNRSAITKSDSSWVKKWYPGTK